MNSSKILKYTLVSSLINTAAITGVLVFLGTQDTKTPTLKPPIVAEGRGKKETKRTSPIVKKKWKSKPKKVVTSPKAKKNRNVASKKKCKRKVICVRYKSSKCCRKPDVVSVPANLREYYNYDPLKKVWVWRG